MRQLAADRACVGRVRRGPALGGLPVGGLLDDIDARRGFRGGMLVRRRNHALPGKGQQSCEQDKPSSPAGIEVAADNRRGVKPDAAHYRALFLNRPTIKQSCAFGFVIRAPAMAPQFVICCIVSRINPV